MSMFKDRPGKETSSRVGAAVQSPVAAEALRIDPVLLNRYIQNLRNQQNLLVGAMAGGLAATATALLLAVITAVTRYQIGWMAIGVGFTTGLAIQVAGNGIDKSFRFIGAILAVTGCLFSNLLTALIYLAPQEGVPVLGLLLRLNVERTVWIFKETFQVMDLLFYVLAASAGYQYAARRLSRAELEKLQATGAAT